MKINSIGINNKICGFKSDIKSSNTNPQNKEEDVQIRLIDYAVAKPIEIQKQEKIHNRQKSLTPISSEAEYNELLNEIMSYKDNPWRTMLTPPFICPWGYENIDNDLKGLICYCGDNDKSGIINSWLTARQLPKNLAVNDEQISKIIRTMDYSLKKLDDKYGKYEGVVYRNGFFNPITDKQYYSTSTQSINAVKHFNKFLPSENNPYSIIYLKNGHKIMDFQKEADSFIARRFAETEKEILIDRKSKFKLVPEYKYTEDIKRQMAILLTQAVKKYDDINEADIQRTLKYQSYLMKYISVWEEI